MFTNMDIRTFSFYLISIVNIFFVPFFSLAFCQKIKSGSSLDLNPFCRYAIYTVSVLILSKLTTVAIGVITGESVAFYSLIYTLTALAFSLFIPVFFKALLSRFELTVNIKNNKDQK